MEDNDIFYQYEKISQRGRGALCRGRLQEATLCFEEALRIEQEIHLRGVLMSQKSQERNSVCSDSPSAASDSSSGAGSDYTDEPIFASSPITGTPPSTPSHSYSTKKYPEVLKQFRKHFTAAERKILTNPEDETGYLQKGAILCALNSWDAAGKVYTTGIQRCRDEKNKLRYALADLNRLENLMTSVSLDMQARTDSHASLNSFSSSEGDRLSASDKSSSPKSSPGALKQVTSFFTRLRNKAFSPKLVPLNDTVEYRSTKTRSMGDLLDHSKDDTDAASPVKSVFKRRQKSQSVTFDELDLNSSTISQPKQLKKPKRTRSISFDLTDTVV